MLLALSVISRQSQRLGAASYRVFDEHGGSIGRGKHADWQIDDPDNVLSGKHAAIRFVDGRFVLEDTSTNGTGLNRADALVPRGQLVPLGDGDHLYLGDFEIMVQIIADPPAAAAAAPPAPPAPYAPPAYAPPAPAAPAAPYAAAYPSPPADDDDLPFDFRPPPAEPPAAPAAWPLPPQAAPIEPLPAAPYGDGLAGLFGDEAPARQPVAPPPSAAAYPPPQPQAAWQPPPQPQAAWQPPPQPQAAWQPPPQAAWQPPPQPQAAWQPPPQPPPAGGGVGVDLGSLFSSIGIDPSSVPPEIAGQLGAILRISTQGLIDVLKARAEVKDQFRISKTYIRPVENNPLKFASSPEDALHTLFVKKNPGYVGPVEAFQQAFDDLGRHQLGMLAGMQAAFGAVLQRFNPEMIETAADKTSKKGGMLGVLRRTYWDHYKDYFAAMAHDSEATFQQVFGEAFVRAYDDQIRRLEDGAARQRRR